LIDSSGSVGSANFGKMKKLVGDITDRLVPEAWGNKGVKVAAVKYGNGFIETSETGGSDSYSITSAKKIMMGEKAWSWDYAELKTALESEEHARGFTNLAQAYLMAQTLFDLPAEVEGARHDANIRKIIVLTDGSVSFKREAQDAFDTIDTKGTRVNMVIFGGETYDEEINQMVTRPHHQSIMHRAKGFDELTGDATRALVASEILTSFCPATDSPKKRATMDLMRGFQLWKENQTCMSWYTDATVQADGKTSDWFSWSGVSLETFPKEQIVEKCAAAAQSLGANAFEVGVNPDKDGFMYGVCLVADKDSERGEGGCKGFKAWWTGSNKSVKWLPHQGLNVYKVMTPEMEEKATKAASVKGVI